MEYEVVPTEEQHFEGLHRALDTVARERRFLAFLQAPPFDQSILFYQHIVRNDFSQFIAIKRKEVVGWCDILPTLGEARAHVGILGIGLISEARNKGIGAMLMAATIAKARTKGIRRIELSVRTDNVNAKILYERFGFMVEGLQRKVFCVDGRFFDAYSMALLLKDEVAAVD